MEEDQIIRKNQTHRKNGGERCSGVWLVAREAGLTTSRRVGVQLAPAK